MSVLGNSGNWWILAIYVFVSCVVTWIVYLSVRHVRNSIALGFSDVSSDQYNDIESVAVSESDHRHH